MLVDRPEGEHVGHLIPAPTRVTVERVDDGEIAALRIDSSDEPPTRVRFPYARPGEVAGHESERWRASGPPEGGRGAAGYAERGQGGADRQRWEVRIGSAVYGPDGPVGEVERVLLDSATLRATHVVVRRGGLLGRHQLVPLDWAGEIGPERIVLDVGREQLDRLPEYRPDNVIRSEVEAALFDE